MKSVTHKWLRNTIRSHREVFFRKHQLRVEDGYPATVAGRINSGYCREFALEILQLARLRFGILGARQINVVGESYTGKDFVAAELAFEADACSGEHFWLEFKGKHYDAEAWEGVIHWRCLPFYRH